MNNKITDDDCLPSEDIVSRTNLCEDLKALIASISVTDRVSASEARLRWDKIAKPVRGLGILEEALVKIAGVQRTADIDIEKKCVVVMCADHGVIREGVSQADERVTRIVAENFLRGKTCCAIMAKRCGADVYPVDIGMAEDSVVENHKIARGTSNIVFEPAMTREQAEEAVLVGARKAIKLAAEGYKLLAAGEMGAGNTTAASAVAAVLLGLSAEKVTGRGAGLSDEAFARKIEVIKTALARHRPDPKDAIDVLAKVGGYDIAGMAGLCLGCAFSGITAVADGLISLTAAAIAVRLCPGAAGYILASHMPAEPAGRALIDDLGLRPVLDCGFALGEGAGAVMMFPLLDMAHAVYTDMSTFEELQVEQYTHYAGSARDI